MYVGLALAAIGALLLYRTWTTLAFVAMLPVLVARARREEESLAERFGARWDSYRRRVPAWIPDLGETDP
jgi:protein-S-isoprenylcysteine O-methyltransferase Ste14